MSFVHLHTHSHYSLLDGLSKIDELVTKVKETGMPALALTDHGNLYGALEFYKKCRAHGIKPIIGVEAYVAERRHQDKEPNLDNRRYHLTLLAKNLNGYRNLIKLVTIAHLAGFYYKPRVDKDLLRRHREGLICLSGCLGGELSQALWNRDQERAAAVVKEHQEIFGPENYFIEIMHHPKIERQEEITQALIRVARQHQIPLVATQDVHYLEPADREAQDTLIAIQTGGEAEDTKRFFNKEEDFSLIDPATARRYFSQTPEAVENTLVIAERCRLELELGRWVFPDFKLTRAATPDEELELAANAALETYRKNHISREQEAVDRALYELAVIKKKGYSPYFLVVADIINFARQRGIFTNTRGSAAGSFICFLLGITNVDPLVYELPFERFLNVDRPSPPDIDMDFADKRRDEVIEYVKQKYGAERVAQIGTFGSMMARGAVRDVARALGYPYATGDRISRLIPFGSQGFPMTIERALKINPELKKMSGEDADVKRIIGLAEKLEGGARHISVHAAGVVIAPTVLTDFVPIQHDPKGGKMITQYDMHAVEDAGLLKFDFLGIRNLSILEDAIRLVKQTTAQTIEIENIPLDDPKTFGLLARGETAGLFQLNGSGMTKWLKELRPTSIFDINAMVALYRPGPMESIPEYIKRKHHPRLIKYLDPRLKDILRQSYGVITYQDDVMMIAVELAGYSWTEADKLRRAMGKKIPKEMQAQKEKLISGLTANGMTAAKAEALWHLIEAFAAYGFNKAHAASYGQVAYQTAYMKAHFPAEYMTAVLSAEAGDTETIAEAIGECRRLGLAVLPPDINQSFGDFTVIKGQNKKPDTIRFGLVTIKNLGAEIAEAIVSERQARGQFRSLGDFLERIKHRHLNKKSLEALIQAGALDSLGEERAKLLFNLDTLLVYHQAVMRAGADQDSLFDLMADAASAPALKLKDCPPATAAERLAWEKTLLGLYVSGHPLEPYREKLLASDKTIKAAKEAGDGQTVVIGALVEGVRQITTKQGQLMAFLKVSDFTGSIEVVIFPSLFGENNELIQPEQCLAIRGRLSIRNNEPSLVAEKLKALYNPN